MMHSSAILINGFQSIREMHGVLGKPILGKEFCPFYDRPSKHREDCRDGRDLSLL